MKELIQEYKTEHNLFMDKINNTPIVNLNLNEYLKASIDSHKDKSSLCVGWNYLKTNLIKELRDILLNPEYQKITYNSENTEFILNSLNVTDATKELKDQLESFVYVWKSIKRDCDKEEREQNLKIALEKEGFKKIELFKRTGQEAISETKEQYTERIKNYYKEFENKKVLCVMDFSCIGLLGSFNRKDEKEGKLVYSDYHNALMLIPKRSRTRGHIITNDFYIKEVV